MHRTKNEASHESALASNFSKIHLIKCNYYELFLLMSPPPPAGGAGVGAAAEAR